jgi:hypothetical protein
MVDRGGGAIVQERIGTDAMKSEASKVKSRRKCSLPLWRVHKIKRIYLASRTHGLFIT